MYSNGPFNYNQAPFGTQGQYQSVQSPDMGTSFGYPTNPVYSPVQQMGGQTAAGQQAQQMPSQMQQQMPAAGMQQMPAAGMQIPITGAAPVDFDLIPTTPVMDIEYTQGYLKTQIGRRVKVEFLIGTNMLVDREGTLVDVGISYIIINEVETDDLLLCDIYSIKFVRFYF